MTSHEEQCVQPIVKNGHYQIFLFFLKLNEFLDGKHLENYDTLYETVLTVSTVRGQSSLKTRPKRWFMVTFKNEEIFIF